MVWSFSASCSWRPLDWRIRHSHLASTLFHSLVPWWRPRRIRPQITRLSQLENSAMGMWPICKNSIIPDCFEKKIAWYKILIHVWIVLFLRITMCFPYLWCTQHAQLIIGTWPIYKKTLPTTDLNKKNFHWIKYLLTTLFSFLFNLYWMNTRLDLTISSLNLQDNLSWFEGYVLLFRLSAKSCIFVITFRGWPLVTPVCWYHNMNSTLQCSWISRRVSDIHAQALVTEYH